MNKAKEEIAVLLKKAAKLKEINLEVPPDTSLGDYAFPCFQLSKQFKKNPIEIAMELAKSLKPTKLIKEIKEIGPYLNFVINKQALAGLLIKEILKQSYGRGCPKKEKVMVEFSQPNTHKGFHIGHLRNVCIGDALTKILSFSGYKVIPANYINDTGVHVAKCLAYYLKYAKGKEPQKNKGEWLGRLYAKAAAISDPDFKKEIDQIHLKIENKDPELMKIWKKTRKWSLDDFNAIYKELNVNFDVWFYDNELTEPGKQIVKELMKKGIAEESEGAIIVDLKDLPVALILKSDGTSLYLTKDLALAKVKFERYKIDKSIYVVASEQSLHFKQLFKILELYGFKQAKDCCHLSYELVMLKQGKMSSRAGNIILYSELAEKLRKAILKAIDKRHKEWSKKQKQESESALFSAAVKFGMLKQENNKVITFDIEKALDFEGETGPYVQYAHVRIASILQKYGKKVAGKLWVKSFATQEDEKLILLLNKFPDIIEEAAESYKPYLLARYLLDLSQAFNEFYHACPILQADTDTKIARLYLISAVQQVLKNGLNLLGIEAPEKM